MLEFLFFLNYICIENLVSPYSFLFLVILFMLEFIVVRFTFVYPHVCCDRYFLHIVVYECGIRRMIGIYSFCFALVVCLHLLLVVSKSCQLCKLCKANYL